MNKLFILILVLIITSFAFASDPKINSVDYNQPFVNQPTTFTVNFTPDDLNSGIIRFVDNGYLISQRAFDNTMNQVQFTYTWNVKETRNIKFYFVDVNIENDTDLTNNEWNKAINIKTGLDLTISTLTVSPLQITKGQTVKFNFKIANIGDENYSGTIPVELFVNSIKVCSTLVDLNSPDGNCSWTVDSNANSFTVLAKVNPDNLITEFSITNNTKSIDTISIDRPDLIVDKINVSQQIRRGAVTNIGVIVKNSGGALAENINASVYLSHLGSTYLIYQQTIPEIFANSSQGFNYAYIFSDVGDYTIKVKLDENNSINEIYENNNEFSYKVTIVDFNFDTIIAENDQLRKDNGTLQGQYNSCLAENSSFKVDIMNNETTIKNCQTNLQSCNTNNATTIANWRKEYDSNQQAMIEIMRGENNKLVQEKASLEQAKNLEIKAITDEKNQWSGMVILGMLAYVVWLAYGEWQKSKPKKAVNTYG